MKFRVMKDVEIKNMDFFALPTIIPAGTILEVEEVEEKKRSCGEPLCPNCSV